MIKAVYRDGKTFQGNTLEEIMEKIWLSTTADTTTLNEYLQVTSDRIRTAFNVVVEPEAATLIFAQALLGVLKIYMNKDVTSPVGILDRMKIKASESA